MDILLKHTSHCSHTFCMLWPHLVPYQWFFFRSLIKLAFFSLRCTQAYISLFLLCSRLQFSNSCMSFNNFNICWPLHQTMAMIPKLPTITSTLCSSSVVPKRACACFNPLKILCWVWIWTTADQLVDDSGLGHAFTFTINVALPKYLSWALCRNWELFYIRTCTNLLWVSIFFPRRQEIVQNLLAQK